MTLAFLKMGRERQYFLMAAILGPDTRESIWESDFKARLTARIRAIVFKPWECDGAFNALPLAIGELDPIEESLATVGFHCRIHMHEAVKHTVKHRIWGGHGHRLLTVLA